MNLVQVTQVTVSLSVTNSTPALDYPKPIREQGVGSGGVDPCLLGKIYDPLRHKFTTPFEKFGTFYYIVTSLLLNRDFYDPLLEIKTTPICQN